MTEKEWVSELQAKLNDDLRKYRPYAKGWTVRVGQGDRLTYANEVFRYDKADRPTTQSYKYQTDLLIYEFHENEDWIPRVVIECEMGVNTHHLITYSTKAFTHKHVHPCLRYGLLIGDYASCLPAKAIRHGAYFDFMMYWASPDSTANEMNELLRVLREEIEASRTLEGLLAKGELKDETGAWMLHRQLVVKYMKN